MSGSNEVDSGKGVKWMKSRKDRVIDGVCAGLADYLGADVTLVRVIWLLTVFIKGIGLIAYILAAIFVPVNPAHRSLQPEEKKKTNHALLWSVILIVLGILLLWDRWDWRFFGDFPFHYPFFRWGSIPWGTVLPLALIVLGIVYIVIALRKESPAESVGDQRSSAGKQKPSAKTSVRPRIMRSRQEKLLAGVCAAIAKHLEIDPTFVRIAFVILALLSHPALGIIAYVILVLIIPPENISSSSGKVN